jgi:hypothetical protein
MEIFKTVKELASLLQKMGNVDMLRQMVALQQQVTDLVEENRLLKQQASNRKHATFKDNSYWISEDGPFCSSCLDCNGKLVRLHKRPRYHPQCPVCKTFAPAPEQPNSESQQPESQRRVTRSGYLARRD